MNGIAKRGRVMVWGLAVGALTVFAGCAEKLQEKEDKVIRVVRNLGGREGFRRHWRAWKSAYERKYPGWTLELIDLGDTDAAGYYKTRVATGDLPEIVQTWLLTPYLADGGYIQPLPDSFYEKFGIPLPEPYKGKRYTSQGGLQIVGIAVNRKMWADAGVTEPPATWAEFIAGLDRIRKMGNRPLVYGGRQWSAAMPLTCAIQSEMYDRGPDAPGPSWSRLMDEEKVRFASNPTARMILENMVYLLDNFVEKGAGSDGYNEEQRDFYGGEGATWIMGCWIGGEIEPNQVDFEIDYWPIPSMTGRPPTFLGSPQLQSGWAISSAVQGEKLEKAIAAFEVFYEPEVHEIYLNAEGQFKLAEKVPIKGLQSDWPATQKFFDNMTARLEQYGYVSGWQRALDDKSPDGAAFERIMQDILAGNRDVDALLKMLDDEWDSARKGR